MIFINLFSFLFTLATSTSLDYSFVVPLTGSSDGLFHDGDVEVARFNNPTSVALSPDDSFALISDTSNHLIRYYNSSTGETFTIAGLLKSPGLVDGVGSSTRFNIPMGISISPNNLFALIADYGNHLIRKLIISTSQVSTFASGFNAPTDVTISSDGSYALVSNSGNNMIDKIIMRAPTSSPTPEPTFEPTSLPTSEPTFTPTSEPTFEPTSFPTFTPSSEPTFTPSSEPTFSPTSFPTSEPTFEPTSLPTSEPTFTPTSEPTFSPTSFPTSKPTSLPTSEPTIKPTSEPTIKPTSEPTSFPTLKPTFTPTYEPTFTPTSFPTLKPTFSPSLIPTRIPTQSPTLVSPPFDVSVTSLVGLDGNFGIVNGIGTNARINNPRGIKISHDGTFALLADGFLRKIIISTLQVTTIASSFSPEDIDLSSDDSFALVATANTIMKYILSTNTVNSFVGSTPAGATNGIGTSALLNGPFNVALSPDQKFALVVDSGNKLVRQIVMSTVSVTTLVGSTSGNLDGVGTNAKLYSPYGIAISPDNSYALLSQGNGLVRKITISTATITQFASGSLLAWTLSISPNGMFALVVDHYGYVVRHIVISTAVVSVLAGTAGTAGSTNGIGTNAQFRQPCGIDISPDNSFVLVSDTENGLIRKLTVI